MPENLLYYGDNLEGNLPGLPILTVNELLHGTGIDMPPLRQVSATFKRAPRVKRSARDKPTLPMDDSAP
jgi:hypothetical protein